MKSIVSIIRENTNLIIEDFWYHNRAGGLDNRVMFMGKCPLCHARTKFNLKVDAVDTEEMIANTVLSELGVYCKYCGTILRPNHVKHCIDANAEYNATCGSERSKYLQRHAEQMMAIYEDDKAFYEGEEKEKRLAEMCEVIDSKFSKSEQKRMLEDFRTNTLAPYKQFQRENFDEIWKKMNSY